MVALRELGSLLLLSVFLPSTVLSQRSADSALNVLDSTDFFVCGSSVQGLDGHYVISDELQSDRQTPVFVREDDDQDDDALATPATTDFRLYRHNGFWLLADVAQWPPKTHFRCDPTAGSDAMAACGMNLQTPPRVGYSPVDATTARDHLELHASDCESVLTLSTPSPKAEL